MEREVRDELKAPSWEKMGGRQCQELIEEMQEAEDKGKENSMG